MPLFFTDTATTTQLNRLRGIGSTAAPFGWRGYSADQYVSLRPNTTIFKARVNGAISGGPYLQVAYDNVTIGSISDVRPHFRVIISPTDNRRDPNAITLRVRDEAHTSSILYTSEDSRDIPDNAWIFIIEDCQLTDKLARPISATVQAKDGDDPFERLAQVVDGLEAVYIGYVDATTGVLTLELDASDSYPVDYDALGTFEYQWTFKTGTYNVTVNSLTDPSLTVEIDEGHQIAELLITDTSNGISWLRYFDIFAHGDTFKPVMGFDGAQWSGELQNGFTANVVAFTGVDDVLDETFAAIWRPRDFYNGIKGALIEGRNIDFVGWINHEENTGESSEEFSFVSEVSFEFVGVGARLALLEAQILALRNSATPDEWDEIEEFYISWKGKIHFWQRHTTLLHLFPLAFSNSMKNTNYINTLTSNQGGNALASASGLAQSVNGSIEFSPDGRIQVVRDLRYMTALDHTDAIRVATFDQRDLHSIKESRNHFERYGQVIADGAFYNAITGVMTAVRAIAPGHARGRGAEDGSLSGQTLTETAYRSVAEAELRQRAADYLLVLNDDGNELTVEHPGGYFALLIPSLGHTYAWELDGSENVRGITYDSNTLWLLKSVQLGHNNETGSRTCTATYVKLIGPGSLGDTIEEIAPGEVPIAVADISGLPAFEDEWPEILFPDAGLLPSQIKPEWLNPPKDRVAKIDGSTLLVWDDNTLLLVQHFIALTTPQVRDITPDGLGSFEIKYAVFDPLNKAVAGGNNYAYVLVSDGTDSKVYSTANVFNPSPTWTEGATVSGLYKKLAGTSVDGGIEIYSPGDSATVSYNFLTGQQGWTAFVAGGGQVMANYVAGSGWEDTYPTPGPADSIQIVSPAIVGATLITQVRVTFSTNWTGTSPRIRVFNSTLTTTYMDTTENGSTTIPLTGNAPINQITIVADPYDGSSQNFAGFITAVEITYSTSSAKTRNSSDRGATWGSAQTVGGSPGSVGGFDTQRAGAVQYAASDAQVKKATTLGGSYSNAPGGTLTAQPVSILQPYYTWNSTTSKNTTGSSPDYAVLTNASGSSVKRITGAGTVTDVTPIAGFTGYGDKHLTALYGTHMAVAGTVSGTQKVYACKNAGGTPTWVLVRSTTNCNMIRCRRNDTRAKDASTGNGGQLYIGDTLSIYYTSQWTGTPYVRNLPITPKGFEVLN